MQEEGSVVFSLAGADLVRFLFAVAALLAAAHVLGYIAERLAIPRVIGEVSAGLLLGPTVLGMWFPNAFHALFLGFSSEGSLFGFLSQLGLMLLMFHSGLKFQARFEASDLRIGAAIIAASTVLPFLAGWLLTMVWDPAPFLGPANQLTALKIVIAISIAVTSIPVISKIFADLGILHSRFAKVIVAVAVVHDILLWVALAVASSLVSSHGQVDAGVLLKSLGVTFGFLAACTVALPWMLRRVTSRRVNVLFRASFLGYFLLILLLISDIAGYLKVDVMYGALLAGVATKLTLPERLRERVEASTRDLSFSLFIPLYFAVVGLQLDLAHQFSVGFFLLYVLFATATQTLVVYGTCRAIRCDRLTSLNLAAAMNARGGPGIVLSTVAYSLGIINQNFFAILVMLALVTSWMAGSWLRWVIRRGERLMPGDEHLVIQRATPEPTDWVPGLETGQR